MAKKLTEDELKWILSVDATKAQQELRVLTKDNNKLNASNKELKERMIDLIGAGKKESDEYKNLSKEVEKNNTAIDKNKAKIKALESTMGVGALTMSQLRKQAKDLQRQLDNTSQATHPENYKKLEQNLAAVKTRMAELRVGGENTGKALSSSFGKVSTVVKGFLALSVVGYLKDLVSNAIDVRKEFAKYEAVLRNTFQSQEKAAQAMSMLKKLAQETPYSLQEVTEAYIKMVNRGILPTHDELIKLGDLASSQGKSLDQLIEALLDAQTGEFERLKEFGVKANKENDKVKFGFKGITTEVKFTEKAISDYLYSLGDLQGVQGGMAIQMDELEGKFSNLGDTWDSLMNKIGSKLEPTVKSFLSFLSVNIQKVSEVFTPLNEAYQIQFDKVVSLETKLPSLISRYDELKSKTNLSKEEHEELNRTISSLAKIVPGAITAFDEYGNAIDINTEKVYQFLEAEQNRLKYEYADLIQKAEDDIQKARKLKQKFEKELSEGGAYKTDKKTGDMFLLPYTEEQVNQKVELIKKQGEIIQGAEETIKKFTGKNLQEQVEGQKQAIIKRKEFNNMTKEQLDQYIQTNKDAADKYIEIAKEIYEHKFKEDKKTETSKETKSTLELKLKELENAHDAELSELKSIQLKEGHTELFYNMQRLSADSKFYQDRLKLLYDYQKKTTDPKLQADITKNINATQKSVLETQEKRDEEMLRILKDNQNKRLSTEEQSFKIQQITFEKRLTQKQITQQQYDMLMLSAEATTAENRLKINQSYLQDVTSIELSSGNLKAKAVEEANQVVMDADLKASKSRASQEKALQNLVKDFKGEFKLTTIDEDTDAQMKVLEAAYQARKEMAEEEHIDSAELDAAYEKAKTQLLQQEEDRRNQVRSQYGLLSMQEQYEIEQELLKQQYDQGLINEEEYQRTKNQIKTNYLKKSYDTYAGMFSGAITALQDAELANIDAKYDAEIQRAGDNSEEVARLEQEKENKKLSVQKKYAGVQFAIKVSEIITNTAVSIMQAFAQLGPIGGAIAAAMLTATGAAQIAVANAERKKVMNMTVDGSSSSESNTGSRVLTGKQSGGYIDVIRAQDGKEFNTNFDPGKRGFIDKPTVIVGEGPTGRSQEWVASNDALQNPTVAPIINMLNESQEKGEIRTVDMNQLMRKRMAGFESGGNISPTANTQTSAPEVSSPVESIAGNETIKKLYDLLYKLDKEGFRAYVVYSDIERKKQTLDKTRKLGGK